MKLYNSSSMVPQSPCPSLTEQLHVYLGPVRTGWEQSLKAEPLATQLLAERLSLAQRAGPT
jgi:hypothetical protein